MLTVHALAAVVSIEWFALLFIPSLCQHSMLRCALIAFRTRRFQFRILSYPHKGRHVCQPFSLRDVRWGIANAAHKARTPAFARKYGV